MISLLRFTLLAFVFLYLASSKGAAQIAQLDTLSAPKHSLPSGALDTTSFTFRDTDLRDIFRALATEHKLNIFLDNSITKRASLALSSVRVIDALHLLCQENGLVMKEEGGIFTVSPPPPALPPPPKDPAVAYENGLLSVELKGDDLEKVVLEIQKKSGKNILVISGTTGSVSGKLFDVDFDLGFTQLMNNNGFAVQKKNGIYAVSRLDYFVGTPPPAPAGGGTAPQRNGPYWVSVKDSLVSLDVTNAPLDRVVSDLLRQLSADVVFYNQISGQVTARATSVRASRALDLLFRNSAFTYKESEGVFFVGEKTNKALVGSRLLKLNHLKAEQVLEMIPQSLSSQAALKVLKEQNGLIVTAATDVIEQVREYLLALDRPVPQVLIEALVVDYDVTEGSEFGVQAALGLGTDTTGTNRHGTLYPGIDMSFNGTAVNHMLEQAGSVKLFGKEFNLAKLGRLPKDFFLNLKAMEKDGLANVRSRPLIATLNGNKASLSIGTTQYFLLKTTTPYRDPQQVVFQETQTFQTIEADVKLELTPYVGSDSLITLELKPDFKTPVGQLSPEVPPSINRRAINSTVVVKEGETIVLGGLISDGDSETSTKVPLLGSIPLLGKLFSSTSKSTRKSELVIYVTPHVSYGEPFHQAYRSHSDD